MSGKWFSPFPIQVMTFRGRFQRHGVPFGVRGHDAWAWPRASACAIARSEVIKWRFDSIRETRSRVGSSSREHKGKLRAQECMEETPDGLSGVSPSRSRTISNDWSHSP